MGQRLIIEVFNQGKALANAYFHEGAYTNSALAVISRILENQDSVKKACTADGVLDPLLYAVRLLEDSGSFAGLDCDDEDSSFHMMSELYPDKEFKKAHDRYSGIISTTEEEMSKSMQYCDGYASLCIDCETVRLECIGIADDDELYENACFKQGVDDFPEEESEEAVNKYIKTLPVNDSISEWLENGAGFDEWESFSSSLSCMPNVFVSGGRIYSKM